MDHELLARLSQLRERLVRAWSAETSTDPDGWSPQCPSRGQCTVTVLIVQNELGGEIVRAFVGPYSHFWNVLPGGVEVDLTRDQFPVWISAPVEPRSREYVLSTARADGVTTEQRYQLLLRRLDP